jgi:hypothetical protein
MKRTLLALIVLAGAIATGCSADDARGELRGAGGGQPSLGGGPPADGHDDAKPSSQEEGATTAPVAAARYHGCTKLTYAALGSILTSRGATATGGQNALTIYKNGAPALGVANYAGRVPEALVGSTSAMAKLFDILVAAAPEIRQNLATTSACPGVTIADGQGRFSKDGLTCITGALATDDHVAVANQAVADAVKGGATQAQGIQLAIAAAMEAAHTCE